MSTRKEVQLQTEKVISRILYGQSPAAQKASLANLRRGVGREPGSLPDLWGEFLLDLPETMYGRDGKPSREEWAIYMAVTLFALHQQGHDPAIEPMYRAGNSFGEAVEGLVTDENDFPRILKRINAVATAASIQALERHLRSLIQLLRAKGIPVDYSSLAGDLFQYQFPESVSQIRLRWGQDFYGAYNRSRKQEVEEQ